MKSKALNKLVLMQLFIITCHKRAYHCCVINCHDVNEKELLQEKCLNSQAKYC